MDAELAAVEDVAQVPDLTDEQLNATLKARYMHDRIYVRCAVLCCDRGGALKTNDV